MHFHSFINNIQHKNSQFSLKMSDFYTFMYKMLLLNSFFVENIRCLHFYVQNFTF